MSPFSFLAGLLGEGPPGGLEGVDQPPASQTPQSSAERSGSLGGGAAPKTKPRRRGGKKRGKPTVDDLETLQIRGRVSGHGGSRGGRNEGWRPERYLQNHSTHSALSLPSDLISACAHSHPQDYRNWMNERDDILVARPQRGLGALPAGAAGAKSALVVAPATAAAMPGGAWPEELQVGATAMGGLNGRAWGCLGVGR